MGQIQCYSCEEFRSDIVVNKSKIFKNLNLLMCKRCSTSMYEPRWVIVLAGRQYGSDLVKTYVIDHLYHGEEISATELLV